jgi:SET domain-containing protein
MLLIKKTKKLGRGVFTDSNLSQDQLIETSPLIVISKSKEVDSIMDTILGNYAYYFTATKIAFAGGFGSFFNHNENNNVRWEVDHKKQQIRYYTTRDIKKNEQLFLNYGYSIRDI